MRASHYQSGKHLDADETYEVSGSCPVCRLGDQRRAVYEIQKSPSIVMLHCPNCRACSASRMPTQKFIDSFYASFYRDSDRKVTMGNPHRFAAHVTRFMPELLHIPALRILDFGGGDSSLSRAIVRQIREVSNRQIPASIEVVDYQQPGSSGVDAIAITGHRELSSILGTFDLILASAILEHIPDAYAAIQGLLKTAAAGTFMYARTPFVLPLARLLRSLDIIYPAHVHDMGSAFWGSFTRTYRLNADIIRSAPSFVETDFVQSPIRTTLAYILKLPAHLEILMSRAGTVPIWNFVGGWEVVIRFK